MERISNYKEAAVSLVDNLRNSPVESNYKKICLAALDYAHRVSKDSRLSEEKKRLTGKLLELGVSINNFYDIDLLDTEEYKDLRKEFRGMAPERENDFQRYRKELSTLEKNRPIPSEFHENNIKRLETIKCYREDVNRLSLAFTFAVAFDKPLSGYYEGFDAQTEEERSLFEGFHNAVMAMQVVDDIVGRKGDIAKDRPSFYTAVCSEAEMEGQNTKATNEPYGQLDNIFNEYYDKANGYLSEKFKPILNAVKFTKTFFPKLSGLVRKYEFLETVTGVNILTDRDRKDM
ncbi:hypothetical protein A2Z67_01470 [Candidatus Woesebacteria bacterium RBG_13_36_22]|uniref:Uncharacterized protein n=1 Tax=Candidatus Woesebacteria bacterium RBG_13_36_22 TaxID=1802478 RepID=A0A1F7WZU4_9BACT|nr:MAG: hypothetical protein A2Z67_01470 [Candidatus Woesebacteria bacterium RBG_13_36_22]